MSITSIPFNIFPVRSDDSKAPMIKGWQTKATRDPATIAQWRADGVTAWGIPTGAINGLFVIDLDIDKDTEEKIGEASLHALGRYDGLFNHVNVKTPSGGSHIYCKHFDGGLNTASKIAPKIDTRGDGGYVVAPTSVTANGVYEGYFPDDLPSVPMGLRAILLHTPPPAPIRNFDRMTPTGEVEALLSYLPADLHYGDWVAVLMALHDRYGGSDVGLALADGWSANGSKYKAGEVATKWRSFKRNGVSWATIPALARQHGADLSAIARGHMS